jgi:Brp/Blh family beta-carotene 15,15'-monooxygenase
VAFKNIFNRVSHISPVHLALITTIASLLLFRAGFSIVLWVFLGIGFLSVGLSHGALDHLTEKTIDSRKLFIQYVLIYLAKGALLGLLWIAMPDMALFVFIAFSAWHFGQADFKEWNLKHGLNSFIWGFIVLATILICHQTETVEVLNHIKGLQIQKAFESLTEKQLLIVQVSITIFSIVFSFFLRSKKLLLTLGYLLLSTTLPLLASFGIYFVAQHSMHGWRHLKADLQSTSFNLWLKALPFSMGGALIFLIFMMLNNKDFFGIFFIVLSCISLPHIISMDKFYRKDI